MKESKRWMAVVLGAVLLLSAVCAFAQDWPQWRGPTRDGKVIGFTAPAAWPQKLVEKWKVTVGTADSTPALVGDKLFVFGREGDNEVTRCLNVADGKEVWKDTTGAPAVGRPAGPVHAGPRAAVAVADGKVVTIGVGGVCTCLDAATGKVLWRKDPFPGVHPRFFEASSPLIADGMAIAFLGGPGNGALIAFDLATGDTKWQWTGEGPNYGSPNLMTADGVKQVVTFTEKSLVGVGLADGKLLWQIPCMPQGMSYNAGTPYVDGQNVIFQAAGFGLKCVKVAKEGDNFAAKEVWGNGDWGVQFSSPVIKDGFLYAVSNGNPCVLFCINAKTGKTAWSDTAARGRQGYGAMLDLGTAIACLPSDSALAVFKPSDKGYEEIANIKIADAATFTTPIFAGKMVYLKSGDYVAALGFE